MRKVGLATLFLGALAHPALAASEASGADGAALSLVWAMPFVGILLSIALLPLIAPSFWHHNFGKVALGWALVFAIPFAIMFGPSTAFAAIAHTILQEYFPFIILLFALFVIAGGILVSGNLIGTPVTNTSMLAIGTAIASVIGTTGASMVLIRPMIRANQDRRRKVHVFVFFIFLVSNIGGSLTPLGDPPLFLGFLKGVDFMWTVTHMALPMLVVTAILLFVFFLIDQSFWRLQKISVPSAVPRRVRLVGRQNIFYLGGVVAAVLMSGLWKPNVTVPFLGEKLALEGLVRDAILLTLAGISYVTTPSRIRIENAFTWGPIREVATLFAGIFIAMIPAIAILRAGEAGALRDLIAFVQSPDGSPNNAAYFWLTGILSSFLDNAPTYLVFFNLAGGDAGTLMGPLSTTLLAISCGAVFMGANTYIGNAPNFMVKSICEENKIAMPSFFAYMIWPAVFLLPPFFLVTWIFF